MTRPTVTGPTVTSVAAATTPVDRGTAGGRIARGALVLIVGPSGAGKDSLLARARAAFAEDERIVFARRVITRASHDESEAYDSMDVDAFARAEAHGAFLLSWRAHGLAYGIPMAATTAALRASQVLVANVSRGVVPAAEAKVERVLVINVTAPREVLARRIAGRGRETAEAIEARLARDAPIRAERARVVEIVNDGPLEVGVTRLVTLLAEFKGTTEENGR